MKWEYHIERLPVTASLSGLLQSLGAEAWELVNFQVAGEFVFFIFKRPIQASTG
jgi:hypothetical protein